MATIKKLRTDAVKAVGTVTDEAARRVEDVTTEMSKQSATARAEATRIATDPTPIYAVVGLTDTVVERAIETVTDTVNLVGKARKSLRPKTIGTTVSERASEVSRRAEALPGKAVSDVAGGLGKVQEGYQELAKRGAGLVDRVKGQQATKDLTKQVNTVVEQGKVLLGTAAKGVTDTRSAAKATVTQGRRQAADVVADVVAGEDVQVTVRKPAARKSAGKPATRAAATTKTATRSAATKKAGTSASRSAATKKAGTTASTSAATKKSGTTAAEKPATKAAATKAAATKKTSTKAAEKPATKAAATTKTSTKAAAKPATKAGATKRTSSKPATKTAATKASTQPATTASTTPSARQTSTAAKRTVSTASNAAAKTADAAQGVVNETAKAVDKAADAVSATAAKVGD